MSTPKQSSRAVSRRSFLRQSLLAGSALAASRPAAAQARTLSIMVNAGQYQDALGGGTREPRGIPDL